jgi:hypothetical protein
MQHCRVSLADLIDYQDGYADAATVQKIEQHLVQGCETCRGRQAQLKRILTALGGHDLHEVPPAIYTRLQAAFRERYAPGPARPALVARPVFDSRLSPALVGVRGGLGDTFQLLHSTADHDIHLWAEKQSGPTWYMIGQVLPHAGGEAIAPAGVLLRATNGVGLTAEADGAEFHLADVASGNYTLQMRLGDGEVVVPDIVVGI